MNNDRFGYKAKPTKAEKVGKTVENWSKEKVGRHPLGNRKTRRKGLQR